MPRVVTFHYTLRDPAGQVLDTSAGGEPIAFLEGAGQIIDGLDERPSLLLRHRQFFSQLTQARTQFR